MVTFVPLIVPKSSVIFLSPPLKYLQKKTQPPSDLEVRPQSSREDAACHQVEQRVLSSFRYSIGDLLTLSGFIFFLLCNEMKCKQAVRPPCITEGADERIIKLLIFNFSFLSLFKKALSATRPQTDLH